MTAHADAILDLWAHLVPYYDIAAELDASKNTVYAAIERGRRQGDPRALRAYRDRREWVKEARSRQIVMLAASGMGVSAIAAALGCTARLVQLRLKEAKRG